MTSIHWIALLAYDGRVRHVAARRREHVEAARQASVHSRVIADLRRAIASGIEGYVAETEPPPGSALTCRNASSPEGFVVHRVDESIGSRTLTVDLDEGTLRCHYDITQPAGDVTVARSIAIQVGHDGVAASAWADGVNCEFATVDLLGTFLLAPILESGYAVAPFVTPASSAAAMP